MKKDLLGKRFGRLIVLRLHHKTRKLTTSKRTGIIISKGFRYYYECICDCGNKTIVFEENITRGLTKSCGCIHSEVIKTKHGLSSSRINRIYRNMKNRCHNKKFPRFENYGGRGIKVCDEWLDKENGFDNFYQWSIKNGYRDNLTIDRIDVNGNYCQENCRWVTYKEQARNKRNNCIIRFDGKSKCVAEWAEIFNVPYKKVKEYIEFLEHSRVLH